jgi:hypothetical protein
MGVDPRVPDKDEISRFKVSAILPDRPRISLAIRNAGAARDAAHESRGGPARFLALSRSPGRPLLAIAGKWLAPLFYLKVMTTEPVPVKVKASPPVPTDGPKMKVIEPVDALALNMIGVPTKLGTLEKPTMPLSVITLPEREPVSGNLQ